MTRPVRRPSAPLSLRLDAAVAALCLAVGVGLGRLSAAPMSGRVLGPVLLCSSAGYVVAAALRRRAPRVVAVVVGAAVVGLVCTWWFVPGLTAWGLPTGAAARQLLHLLGRGAQVIGSRPTPLPGTSGVVLWVAAGSGLVATAAAGLLGLGLGDRRATASVGPDRRAAKAPPVAAALAFPAALFSYTALLSSGSGRVWGTLLFLGALVLVALAIESVGEPVRRPRLPLDRHRRARARLRRRPVASAVALAVPAAAVALVTLVVRPR